MRNHPAPTPPEPRRTPNVITIDAVGRIIPRAELVPIERATNTAYGDARRPVGEPIRYVNEEIWFPLAVAAMPAILLLAVALKVGA